MSLTRKLTRHINRKPKMSLKKGEKNRRCGNLVETASHESYLHFTKGPRHVRTSYAEAN